ncbi:hypothetical protein Ancab_037960 [Ancistrocladus abbreviatus]
MDVRAAPKTGVDLEGNKLKEERENSASQFPNSLPDANLGIAERAVSAVGAAFISAIIVNPLDVAKTRLQAQAAGVPYQNQHGAASLEANKILPPLRSPQSHNHPVAGHESVLSLGSSRYKGTIDVFYKVIHQEGFPRLWRGTFASLALAVPSVGIYLPCYDVFRNYMEGFTEQNAPHMMPYVPLVAGSVARTLAVVGCYPVDLAKTRMQAFTDTHAGAKPPGVLKTLIEVVSPVTSANNFEKLKNYRNLWTGIGAQLARDVPFSAICWATIEPIRRSLLRLVGHEPTAATILGANFSAAFVAGSVAAAVTCPLDVARTRRQIEKDLTRQMRMTTKQTLVEIWRDGGLKGLFTGLGPRVARAGPSTAIVVSFYEVVKYAFHHRHAIQ